MAATIECNYAKKIGLPGYSSHQYSVSIRTEVTDLAQIEQINECFAPDGNGKRAENG